LVEYAKYLSLRGEVERELMVAVADEFDFDPRAGTTDDPLDPESDSSDRELVDEIVAAVAAAWQEASNERIHIDPATLPAKDRTAEELAASVAAGDKLFHSEIAKCSQCHGVTGRGDGELSLAGLQEYDDWNQRELDFRRATEAIAATLQAQQRRGEVDKWALSQLKARQRLEATFLPAEKVRPRDLADGVFRGGGEPKDLFLRIHQGIPGTPMPAHGSPRPGVAGALTDEQIWQLVDYVRSLRGERGRVAQQRAPREAIKAAN
jgi:mono/diheme cytochrome c family protein